MKGGSSVEAVLPAFGWLRRYRRAWFGPDLVAGVVVWALVVPEVMAYARIAGVPVQVGLYSVPLAVVAHMLLGTSRHLFDGPNSTVAIMAAALAQAHYRAPDYLERDVGLDALRRGGTCPTIDALGPEQPQTPHGPLGEHATSDHS